MNRTELIERSLDLCNEEWNIRTRVKILELLERLADEGFLQPPPKRQFTTAELAKKYGVKISTIYHRRSRTGEFRGYRPVAFGVGSNMYVWEQ
jgi:hypothetical protein